MTRAGILNTGLFFFLRMNDIFFILGPQHLPDPSTLLRVVPKRIPPASPRLKGMAEAGVVIGPLWAQQSA